MTEFRIAITSRTFFFLPLMVAHRQGAFDDAGVPIEIIHLDGKSPLDGLESGDFHLASTPPEGVICRIEAGMNNIRFVAGNVSQLSHCLIAQPAIKSISDLKGTRFGCVSLDEGSRFQFEEIAAQHGLTPADYYIDPCGGAPTRWKLLQAGEIDSALQSIPFTYMAEEAGFSNLGAASDYFPDYQFGVFSANLDMAEEIGDRIATVIRVLIQSTVSMLQPKNKDVPVSIANEALGIPIPYAKRAWQDFRDGEMFEPDLAISQSGLAQVVDLMIRAGRIPNTTSIQPEKYVCDQYRLKAMSELRT